MIIQFFKRYQPINYFIVIFIAILLWLKIFFNNDILGANQFDCPIPIYGFIYSFLTSYNLVIISKIIAFILIIIQASFISGINNQYNLFGFRSYLPGLIYILFVSSFEEFKVLHPIHFANIFFILAWFELKKSESSISDSNYFNSAFLIGLSSLFYFNYIYLILVIIIHLIIKQQGSLRRIFIILIGVLSVWYLYLSIFFLFTGHLQDLSLLFNFSFSFKDIINLNLNTNILVIYTFVLILFASLNLLTYYIGLKNNNRGNLTFIFLVFILSLLLLFFTSSSIELVYLTAIPISLFLSLFFTKLRSKWISENLFFIFLIIVFINYTLPELFSSLLNYFFTLNKFSVILT